MSINAENLDVEESAIQESAEEVVEEVVEEAAEENAEEEVLSRDEMSDALAKRLREERAKENGYNVEESDEEEDEEEDEEVIVDLKVDGKIVQKTQAEVDAMGGVAEAQKSLTADRRLQQAAEERQRIEQEKQQLHLAQQQLQAQQAELAKQNKAPDVSNEDVDQAYREYADAVYSGDTEQLIAATKKLQSLQAQPSKAVDTAVEIDRAVKRSIEEANRNASIERGKKAFAQKYSDIMQNQELFNLANEKTVTIMNENPDMSPEEVILEAGRQTQEWVDSIAGRSRVDTTLEQRVESKRKKVSLPSAKAKQSAKQGYKPKTQEEIFADFQKSRAR